MDEGKDRGGKFPPDLFAAGNQQSSFTYNQTSQCEQNNSNDLLLYL